ncbi:MAG: hypothetical protein DRK00_08535 [Thermoprotei archaeon]|nr:MAG: hypothetical protein DRK00_08535 [Thermoprotei archaeon]
MKVKPNSIVPYGCYPLPLIEEESCMITSSRNLFAGAGASLKSDLRRWDSGYGLSSSRILLMSWHALLAASSALSASSPHSCQRCGLPLSEEERRRIIEEEAERRRKLKELERS